MADNTKLSVQKRETTGKKVKKLRKEGIIPANVYGSKIDSVAVQVKQEDLVKAYKSAGETSIVDLTIEGESKTRPVLFSNIQLSPVNRDILHVDFRQVDLTAKIHAEVPVEFIGESKAVSVGGVLIKIKDSIEIEALPTDIPEKFEVDLAKLENIGDMISIADLKAPAKVAILDADDMILVRVDQKKEEEPEPEAEEIAEGEAPAAAAKEDAAEETKEE